MKKASKAKTAGKRARGKKLKKGELLRLIRVPAPERRAHGKIKDSKTVLRAKPKKKSSEALLGREERDILRQYFIMRIAQSCRNIV